MMKLLTHGGLPASEAWQFDAQRKKQLGEIIQKLMSKDYQIAFKAWAEFYEFKRHFMIEDWDAFMSELDEYRARLGHKSVQAIVDEVQKANKETFKPIEEAIGEISAESMQETVNQKPEIEERKAMGAIEKFCIALKMAGEALIEMSGELGKQMAQFETAVETPYATGKPAAPPARDTGTVLAPEAPATHQTPAAEPVVTTAAEAAPAVTREDINSKVLFLVNNKKRKDRVVALLSEFGAKKVGDVKPEQYPELAQKLDLEMAA